MPPTQDRAFAVLQALAAIEEAKRTQPERLAQARGRANDERLAGLRRWLGALPPDDIRFGRTDLKAVQAS